MTLNEKLADKVTQLVDELNEYGMLPDHTPGRGPSVEEVWRKVAAEAPGGAATITEDRDGPGGNLRVLLSDAESSIAITFDPGMKAWVIEPGQSKF